MNRDSAHFLFPIIHTFIFLIPLKYVPSTHKSVEMVLVHLIITESLAACQPEFHSATISTPVYSESAWCVLCFYTGLQAFFKSLARVSSCFLNTLSLQMKSSYYFSRHFYLLPTCNCFMKLFASSLNMHHFIHVTTTSHWKLLPIVKFFWLFALLVKSLVYLHIKCFKNILIPGKWNILNTYIFGEFIFVSFLFVFSDHGCPIMTEPKGKIVWAQATWNS